MCYESKLKFGDYNVCCWNFKYYKYLKIIKQIG
jgi:hypothetical protein